MIVALLAAIIPMVQAAEPSTITVHDAWVRATPPGIQVGGGYVTVTNTGKQADRLVGASSPLAEKAEIHVSETIDSMARMRWLKDGVEIPAGKEVMLAPGGIHLMFMGLKQAIIKGEEVPVTLQFEQAGEIDVLLRAAKIGSLKAPAEDVTHAH
ncbi:copper chaperone PCu(A)C [Castellaniella sp. S9]|uniref:copper chaperone PCu(A)C n=1 Tax=Castellaniella sp. S9 TaxID=2993652 RepID=UPI0022B3A0EA|nr:copper chaperone PCu(A)C [Castellaniella sp. S9]